MFLDCLALLNNNDIDTPILTFDLINPFHLQFLLNQLLKRCETVQSIFSVEKVSIFSFIQKTWRTKFEKIRVEYFVTLWQIFLLKFFYNIFVLVGVGISYNCLANCNSIHLFVRFICISEYFAIFHNAESRLHFIITRRFN